VAESVLVIADRIEIATMIARCLTGIGLRPLVANDMRHAGAPARETPAAVVLDLATPGHCDAVMHWLRRDASRAAMMVVQVSALARNGGAPRGELRADVLVPKPFTPRQDRRWCALRARAARGTAALVAASARRSRRSTSSRARRPIASAFARRA
jgi:DNA-binding response OmpR family regulator